MVPAGFERVAPELRPLLAAGEFPDSHQPVLAARGERASVGAECEGRCLALVPAEAADFLPRGEVPDVDRAGRLLSEVQGREARSIGRESEWRLAGAPDVGPDRE